jgi:chorismate mutase
MDLNQIRSEIDALDDQIAALLKQRMEIVKKVAEYKKQTNTPVADTAREDAILARVCTGEHGELLRPVFEAVFDGSRAYQKEEISHVHADDMH